jgi:hypothetical protein
VAGRDLHRARPRDARAAPHPARLAPRYFRHGARGRRRHAQSDAEPGARARTGSRRWSPRRSSSRRRAAPPSPPARRSSSASTRRSGGPRRSATAAGSPRSDRPPSLLRRLRPGCERDADEDGEEVGARLPRVEDHVAASVLRDVPRRQVSARSRRSRCVAHQGRRPSCPRRTGYRARRTPSSRTCRRSSWCSRRTARPNCSTRARCSRS